MTPSFIFTALAAVCSVLAILFTFLATRFSKKETAEKAASEAAAVQARHETQLTHIRAEATGGDTYPVVRLNTFGPNTFLLSVETIGKFTLFDVVVRVRDEAKFASVKLENLPPEKVWSALHSYSSIIDLRNLGPGEGGGRINVLRDFSVTEDTMAIDFSFDLSARNGAWRQKVVARRSGGRWLIASRISGPYVRDEYPQLSNDFPRDSAGRPDF